MLMETEILQSPWCDLIFSSRNKNYGAYQLRKEHDRNLLVGFMFCLGFLGLAIAYPMISQLITGKEHHVMTLPPESYVITVRKFEFDKQPDITIILDQTLTQAITKVDPLRF